MRPKTHYVNKKLILLFMAPRPAVYKRQRQPLYGLIRERLNLLWNDFVARKIASFG